MSTQQPFSSWAGKRLPGTLRAVWTLGAFMLPSCECISSAGGFFSLASPHDYAAVWRDFMAFQKAIAETLGVCLIYVTLLLYV